MQAFPDTQFDPIKLRDLQAKLTALFFNFLSYQEIEKDEQTLYEHSKPRKKGDTTTHTSLLYALLNKDFSEVEGVSKLITNKIERLLKQKKEDLENIVKDSAEFYYEKYQVENLFLSYQAQLFGRNNLTRRSYFDILEAIEGFYLTTKLKLCAVILQKPIQIDDQNPQEIEMLEELINYCKNTSLENRFPLAAVYFKVMMCLYERGKDIEAYWQAKKLLDTYKDQIHLDDFQNICGLLITAAKLHYNTNDKDFLEELGTLHEWMIDKGALYKGEGLAPLYKNIITIYLRSGRTNEAYKKNEEIRKKLTEDKKFLAAFSDTYEYNLAHIFLYQKRSHKEVHDQLNQAKYVDTFFKIGAYRITIMHYFTRESDYFYQVCNSFQRALNRPSKKLNLSRKDIDRNKRFLQYTKLLFTKRNEYGFDLTKVEKEIKEKDMLEKEWLSAQIVKLKQQNSRS